MVNIEREDLEELLEMAFEMWSMAESEWSSYPAADDLAFLLKMANLSGYERLILKAQDMIRIRIAEEERVVKDYTANLAFDEARKADALLDSKRIIAEAEERLVKLKAIKGGE